MAKNVYECLHWFYHRTSTHVFGIGVDALRVLCVAPEKLDIDGLRARHEQLELLPREQIEKLRGHHFGYRGERVNERRNYVRGGVVTKTKVSSIVIYMPPGIWCLSSCHAEVPLWLQKTK